MYSMMMHAEAIEISWSSPGPPSLQRLMRLLSGVLVLFVAFGTASWCLRVVFVGCVLRWRARRDADRHGECAAVVGFIAAVGGCLAWYRIRVARGRPDLPFFAAPGASLALLLGNICWAVFVDATAWHYGSDIVRPAFDRAMMYLVLGATVPMAALIPWLLTRIERRTLLAAPSSST